MFNPSEVENMSPITTKHRGTSRPKLMESFIVSGGQPICITKLPTLNQYPPPGSRVKRSDDADPRDLLKDALNCEQKCKIYKLFLGFNAFSLRRLTPPLKEVT